MSSGGLINTLFAGEGFAQAMGEAFRMASVAAVVLVLLGGLIFFLPTIIAVLRRIKMRIPICVLNVLAIGTTFVSILIPVIIWLVTMIIAFTGNPAPGRKNKLPEIQIVTNNNNI